MRSWLESKRRFGTGYASVAVTSGRRKARASLRGVRNANRRTGTNLVRTNGLWRLDLDSDLAVVHLGDGNRGGA